MPHIWGQPSGSSCPARMKDCAERAERAWVYGVATHPMSEGGQKPWRTEIFYLKSLLAGRLSWDVEQYARRHPDFPRSSSGGPLNSDRDFEAYRALGYSIVDSLLENEQAVARLGDVPGGDSRRT